MTEPHARCLRPPLITYVILYAVAAPTMVLAVLVARAHIIVFRGAVHFNHLLVHFPNI